MTLQLERVTTPAHYETWAHIYNQNEHLPGVEGADLARRDKEREEGHYLFRGVLLSGGEPVAAGLVRHLVTLYHPQKLWFWCGVLERHRRQGFGSHLYQCLMLKLSSLDPRWVLSSALEEDAVSRGFLKRRGFEARERFANSVLTLANANRDLMERGQRRAKSVDVRVVSLADYRERYGDNWDRAIWRVTNQIEQDLPSIHEITPASFQSFHTDILSASRLSYEESFVALDPQGEPIGVSSLWRDLENETKRHTGLTGVLEPWRRKGIATAMKAAVIEECEARGVATLTTENEDSNPMLDLNRQLGFVEEPATLSYVKTIDANVG